MMAEVIYHDIQVDGRSIEKEPFLQIVKQVRGYKVTQDHDNNFYTLAEDVELQVRGNAGITILRIYGSLEGAITVRDSLLAGIVGLVLD